jgi:hypothetical protein
MTWHLVLTDRKVRLAQRPSPAPISWDGLGRPVSHSDPANSIGIADRQRKRRGCGTEEMQNPKDCSPQTGDPVIGRLDPSSPFCR